LFQVPGQTVPAWTAMEASFQLGNTHPTERMRVMVLLHSQNFTDLHACSFWLPPNTPLRQYQMRTFNTIPWTTPGTNDLAITFYSSSTHTVGYAQIDNVNVRIRPSISVAGTECEHVINAPVSLDPALLPTLEPTATPDMVQEATPLPPPTEVYTEVPSEGGLGE
jgi:hypothetical protein